MTVLVAGATGTVGSEVVRRLAAAGAGLRAGARDPHRAAALLPAGRPVTRLDLEDGATWPAALAGVRRLFLLRPPDVARAPGCSRSWTPSWPPGWSTSWCSRCRR
ncbi:NAD(P)H-binding protein [Geodermatophilus dictyosporus]|uniref:NAD(P)H-binding protein n=1 Tax=Geodermatophilus dictyosporus TaxID=1523247 RepID=UPI000B8364E3|nr:NAD(P)H-binding protein [Geodermatophilus dictyosporus]